MESFDQEWSAAVVDAAPSIDPADNCVVSVVLSTGRSGDRVSYWQVADGRIAVIDAPDGEVDLALTVSPSDAQLIVNGELPVPVAYMQGRLKPAGDNGLWLRMAKASMSPQFRDWARSASAL